MRWTVLLPLKGLPQAKSRLQGASGDAQQHAELVLAMRADTMTAIRAARRVARVLVIVDRPDDLHPQALIQDGVGLNAALTEGAAYAAAHWPQDGVAALVGDLPALRPEELDAALAASGTARTFVADADGSGTTLLAVGPGTALAPKFGTGSAARHAASGAVALAAGPGLRCDVDTPDDLQRAAGVGLGSITRAWAAVVQAACC
jgi:2-phospho-L-lactate/phosphoenolpyruvate guanylyltransferase